MAYKRWYEHTELDRQVSQRSAPPSSCNAVVPDRRRCTKMAAQSVEIPDGQVLCVHTSACMPFEQTRLSVQSWQRETQSLRALTERKTRAQRLDDLDVGNFHCSLILSFEMLLALGSLACGGADVAGRQ